MAFAPQIAYYLDRYRRGDVADAYHCLLELGDEALPELSAEFRAASDNQLREFLLGVIWQHRQQSVIPLLAEALLDPDPRVWREAIDGLVALASPASLEALREARGRQFPKRRDTEEFSRWLEEAIEQMGVKSQTE